MTENWLLLYIVHLCSPSPVTHCLSGMHEYGAGFSILHQGEAGEMGLKQQETGAAAVGLDMLVLD